VQVLIIGLVWPEPCSSAAGGRMLGLIESFCLAGWQVAFASPAQATERQADLASLGVACRAIALNSDCFDAFVAETQPDIVVFDRFMVEEQFGWRVAAACPAALRVLDTEDLHSLRKARQIALQAGLKNASSQPSRDAAVARLLAAAPFSLFKQMAAEEITLREVASIQRCDLTLMISDIEVALLVELFNIPPGKLHYCPFMLTASEVSLPAFDQRRHFISIGNFRHAPNWDAVLWLRERLWPSIRAALPEAELHVYGAYPPPKATALHSHRDGFLVKGWAADAHAVLARSRVCLAPLRFGAGIKGKLADAMTAGTPSVTTPIGAEGMAAVGLSWPGAVAGQAAEFVAEAVALYRDPGRWRQAQCDGAILLSQRFSALDHRPKLIDKIQQSHQHLQEIRTADFTGAMMRHHFHQSTRYMSKWIETKARLREAMGE